MTTVPVEIVGWPTRFVGGDGSTRRLFEEPLTTGATVRSVLRGLSDRFPDLALAVPEEQLRFRDFSIVYGIESLPVRLHATQEEQVAG